MNFIFSATRFLFFVGAILSGTFLVLPTMVIATSSAVDQAIPDPTFDPKIGFAGRILAAERQSDGKTVVAGGFVNVSGAARLNIARLMPDGSNDASFNPPLLRDGITGLAIQPDGKILISFLAQVGSSFRGRIVRLNQDGSVDLTFVTGNGTNGLPIRALLVLSTGDILVGGEFSSYNGTNRRGLIRLESTGAVDTSFTTELTSFNDDANALAEAADGKIYVGGNFTQIAGVNRGAIARLESNGTVDESFNANAGQTIHDIELTSDGKIYIGGRFDINSSLKHVARLEAATGALDSTFVASNQVNSWVLRMDLHSDGKLFVMGLFNTGIRLLDSTGAVDESFSIVSESGGFSVSRVLELEGGKIDVIGEFLYINGHPRSSIVRLNSDFSIDPAYRPYVIHRNLSGLDTVSDVKFQPDGKIVISGTFRQIAGNSISSIARLNADGSFDATFNQANILSQTSPNAAQAIAIQPDGKILVGGNFTSIGGGPANGIARLNPDGTVDPTFGLSNFGVTINSIAVQPDGKILIAGPFTFIDGVARYNVARLNSNGSLDASFDTGTVATSGTAVEIILQPDGKVLVSGLRNSSQTQWASVLRLNSNGTRDTSFNANVGTQIPDIVLEPDGQVFVAGMFDTVNGQTRRGLARLNSDGSLDPTFLGEIPSGTGRATSVELLPDGRYVVAGTFGQVNGFPRPGLAMFDSRGNLHPQVFARNTQEGGVNKVFARDGGKVLVFGNFVIFDGIPTLGAVQLIPNFSPFDFDGDGKTDIGIFRPSVGEWWYQRSSDGQVPAFQFGATTDRVVPADYTGDGKTDIAFWRPTTGEWYILRSEDLSFYSFPFGASEDIPAPADYDNDGKADPAVFRPSTATWFIQRSSDNGTTIAQFGATGDHPVAADYDGDGRADLAIYRPSNGQWWLNRSTAGVIVHQFGDSNDKPVQGDYTGDGKADVAFWRPSTGEWYILRSEDNSYYSAPFGISTDIPAPGDYDGDGKFDTTVFRPSEANWYVQRSTAGTLIQQFGASGDMPIPNAFVR